LSFAAAAIAYGLLLVLLLLGRQPARRGEWVMTAVAAGALWGLGIVVSLVLLGTDPPPRLAIVADALRTCVWVLCLSVALPGKTNAVNIKVILVASTLLLTLFAVVDAMFLQTRSGTQLGLLGLSVIGCLTIEQIFRNVTDEEKAIVRSFLWTIGAILVYDVFVFSDAVMFGGINPVFWSLRGAAAALGAPFLLLSAKRHPDWSSTLFIFREIVFYSATLTGVGLYFLALALGAFVLQMGGGEWGTAIEAAYFIAAFAMLAFVLTSGRWKNSLRVFISKHFYRNRYDYREEWLQLIRTLSDETQNLALDQRSIKALCAIIDSSGGQIWLNREADAKYEPFSAWEAPFPTGEYDYDSKLVRFLQKNRWVIDTREYEQDPERYQNAFQDDSYTLPKDSVIVPLFHQTEMLGIARLNASQMFKTLNYEDHDLLKTVGRQVAAFLAHDIAKERLAEKQQFEAFNKFSAFVMHDLKNLLAQQALLVENAKKFQDRPEFVTDVIRLPQQSPHSLHAVVRTGVANVARRAQQGHSQGRFCLLRRGRCALYFCRRRPVLGAREWRSACQCADSLDSKCARSHIYGRFRDRKPVRLAGRQCRDRDP
jgi:putative PEP-CTERM system histidine kinase